MKRGKRPVNVSISEDIKAKAKRLQEVESRSFSNLVEVLVVREHARVFPAAPTAQIETAVAA